MLVRDVQMGLFLSPTQGCQPARPQILKIDKEVDER